MLLTDAQIQSYLINGYTTIQTTHPPAFHQQILQQIETLYATTGNPGNDILPKVPDLHQILQDPAVHGALLPPRGPFRANPFTSTLRKGVLLPSPGSAPYGERGSVP